MRLGVARPARWNSLLRVHVHRLSMKKYSIVNLADCRYIRIITDREAEKEREREQAEESQRFVTIQSPAGYIAAHFEAQPHVGRSLTLAQLSTSLPTRNSGSSPLSEATSDHEVVDLGARCLGGCRPLGDGKRKSRAVTS